MRPFLLAVATSLAACSSAPAPSTCSCCQPTNPTGFGFENFGQSVFTDTDNDGLSDTRLPDWGTASTLTGSGTITFPKSLFVDTDNDGLPDARMPDAAIASTTTASKSVQQSIRVASSQVATASSREQLDAALANLAAAVAESQRALAASK